MRRNFNPVQWRKFLNPVDWLAWFYGRFFLNHPYRGWAVFVCITFVVVLIIATALWVRAIDKYNEEHPKKDQPSAQGDSAKPPEQKAQIEHLQTWQNVTASRALRVTYYNTTSRTMIVSIRATGVAALVNGNLCSAASSSASGQSQIAFDVPPGSAYLVLPNNGNPTLTGWAELR